MKREIQIPLNEIFKESCCKEAARRSGVSFTTIEKATECGMFERVSYLLCSMHSLVSVAYRLYGEVDMWFSEAGIRRHDIQRECKRFEESCDRWFRFWKSYQSENGSREMLDDVDDLYRQFMDWADLPLYWELGDAQRTKRDVEPMIVIEEDDKFVNIYKDVAERELLADITEEWGVLTTERKDGKRYMQCIGRGMDKSAAMMSAKRLSANDAGRVYIAGCLQSVAERRLEIVPHKAFKNGQTVGSVKKVIKKKA